MAITPRHCRPLFRQSGSRCALPDYKKALTFPAPAKDGVVALSEEHHLAVGNQVATFSTERLHRMKNDHEGIIAEATCRAFVARAGESAAAITPPADPTTQFDVLAGGLT